MKGVAQWDQVCATVEGSQAYASAAVAVADLLDLDESAVHDLLRMNLEAVGHQAAQTPPRAFRSIFNDHLLRPNGVPPRRNLVEVIDPQQASWMRRVRWVEMTRELSADQPALDAIAAGELTVEGWVEETFDLDEESVACVMLIELGDQTVDGRAKLAAYADTYDNGPQT